MKLVWQGPTTPRRLRAELGYDGAELLLCGPVGLIIDYAAYGMIRLVFTHEGLPAHAIRWGLVQPTLDTYKYETAMNAIDVLDWVLAPLPDDARYAPAVMAWHSVAGLFGWDVTSARLRLDNVKRGRNMKWE